MATATVAEHLALDPVLAEVRAIYDARYPIKEGGVFTDHDWMRCQAMLERVGEGSLLDVGVGPGQAFNALARRKDVSELVGVDIKWNDKLIRPERGEMILSTILSLPFQSDRFDTVVCMEVLEHLEPIEFPKALAELRRVCRGTLIATVPYDEPEPLWHQDKPGGHRQRFDDERLDRFFPRAERHLVAPRRRVPWVMLVERGLGTP